MRYRVSKTLVNGLLGFAVCIFAAATSPAAMHDEPACTATQETLDQLAAARKATARFNSINRAEAEGYANINLPVPNMGEHWVKFDLVDFSFDPEKPEALVYADLGNGRLQLVAVEYLSPYVAGMPPSGFSGNCDKWSPFGPGPDLWTLHAWIHQPNLSGTFSKFNPMVP